MKLNSNVDFSFRSKSPFVIPSCIAVAGNLMSAFRRFVRDSGWAFLGRIGALSLGLVSSIFLARILKPADFGTYFLVLTLARVAMLVSQFGMNQVVVRFIAEHVASGTLGKARDVVVKSLQITLIGGCVVGTCYFVSSSFVSRNIFDAPNMATVRGLVFVWIIAGTLRLLAAECFRGFHDLKWASIFELFVFELLFVGFIFGAWFFERKICFYNAVLLSTVAALIGALPAIFILIKKIRGLPVSGEVTYSKLLQTGWPLLVSNLVFVVMSQVGLWVVGIISTPEDVALYASAFRCVLLMQLPLLILNSVVPQFIAKLHAHNKRREIQESLQLVAVAEFVPTMIIYAVFIFLGEPLLALVFGDFYAGSYWILLILGSGILVNAFVGFCGPALMMTGHQNSLMKISLFCGAFVLLFSFPMGKYIGAEGVAIVMALGNILQHLCMLVVVKRKVGVWTMVGNFAGIKRRIISIVS